MTVFQMANSQSTSWLMPLRCILDNWKLFDPLTLRRSHLKFFCATAWPQYPLGDEEHWPEDGSLNYNTILQLDLFCKRQGKWTEVPYIQIFFQLKDMKKLCLKYGIVVCPKSEPTRQMMLCTDNQEKEGSPPTPQKSLEPPTAPELPGAPSLYPNVPPYLGAPPPQKPAQVHPLAETGGEFRPNGVHEPFSVLQLRQIKQDLGSYTDDPGKYTDTFQHIALALDLTWKDIMVIFSQTLSNPEHSRVIKEA